MAKIKMETKDNQAIRHNEAIDWPRGFEIPVVRMLHFWEMYAAKHAERYESKIGEDVFTGEHWKDIGKSLNALLNCETGNLDCGTLQQYIRQTMRENGFSDEETDEI